MDLDVDFITVRWDPETGTFPRKPLAGVEGNVVSASEHFFLLDGHPHVLLVAYHRPRSPARGGSGRLPAAPPVAEARPRTPGPEVTLVADERALYDRIRVWRNALAAARGVSPPILFTNEVAARLARERPATLRDLGAVARFGEKRLHALGPALLTLLVGAAIPDVEVAPQAPASAPPAATGAPTHADDDASAHNDPTSPSDDS